MKTKGIQSLQINKEGEIEIGDRVVKIPELIIDSRMGILISVNFDFLNKVRGKFMLKGGIDGGKE